jgi:D-xylose transport system permease protein
MARSSSAPPPVAASEPLPPADTPRPAAAWQRALGRVDWGAYGLVIGTGAIWLALNFATDGLFLSPRNLTLLMVQGVVLGTVASGVVLIMVMGNIDLSVGSTVGLCATIAAYLQVAHGWDTLPTLAAVALIGLALGIWQGLWVAYAGIPAFIVTLAGLSLFRGAAFFISNGQTFAPMSTSFESIAGGSLDRSQSLLAVVIAAALYIGYLARSTEHGVGTPRSWAVGVASSAARGTPVLVVLAIVAIVGTSYKGIPYPVLILAGVALVIAFVAQQTRFGRHLYAIGGNREAALLAGVSVARHTFFAFAGMGLLYALAGSVLAARVNGAVPDSALGLELDVITACIIGGTSLFGGVGKIQGAILGAIFLTSLNNGMDLLGLSTYIQWIVKGVVLLLAVLLDVSLKRRRAA